MVKRKKIISFVTLFTVLIFLMFFFFGIRILQLLNSFNPMQIAFLESFDIVNNTGQKIEVMPIGVIEGSGKYSPLPRYKNSFPPCVPLDRTKPIKMEPGTTIKVTYDYDDINFRHFLIKDEKGRIFILDTDKTGDLSGSYGPQKDKYVIPDINNLRIAPMELISCFYGVNN